MTAETIAKALGGRKAGAEWMAGSLVPGIIGPRNVL
jgi:hypothetical protein